MATRLICLRTLAAVALALTACGGDGTDANGADTDTEIVDAGDPGELLKSSILAYGGVLVSPDSGELFASGLFKGSVVFGEGDAAVTLAQPEEEGTEDYTAFLAGYDASGGLLWAQCLEQGCGTSVFIRDVGISPDGSGFTALSSYSGEVTVGSGGEAITIGEDGQSGWLLARYSEGGTLEGAHGVVAMDALGFWQPTIRLASQLDGAAIVYSEPFSGTLTIGQGDSAQVVELANSAFVALFSADGALAWLSQIAGATVIAPSRSSDAALIVLAFEAPISLSDGVTTVDLDPGPTGQAIAAARYDETGALVWARIVGVGPIVARDYAVFDDGGFAVSGEYDDGSTFGEGGAATALPVPSSWTSGFFARYDAAGELVAAEQLTDFGELVPTALTPAPGGRAIVTAIEDGNNANADWVDSLPFAPDGYVDPFPRATAFMASFDIGGDVEWVDPIVGFVLLAGEPWFAETWVRGTLASDAAPSGATLIAGAFSEVAGVASGENVALELGASHLETGLVARLGPDGEVAWTDRWLGRAGRVHMDGVFALADEGVIAVGGARRGDVLVGHGAEGADLVNPGGDVELAAGYGADGERQWVRRLWYASASPSAEAFDHLFDCPEMVDEPDDVVEYRNPLDVADFYGAVRAGAVRWVEPECLSLCEPEGEDTLCVSASCETADGAQVEPAYSGRYSGAHEDGYWEIRGAESMSVAPPASSPWQSVSMETASSSEEYNLDKGFFPGYRTTVEFEVAWQGEIAAGTPSDDVATGTIGESTAESESISASWIGSGCGFDSQFEYGHLDLSDSDLFQVDMAGHTVEVTTEDNAWLDGVCVGQVNPNTWEIVGECTE
ncbi:MAG: hypothetical protein M0R80_19085 [Proteobacteria bacterium]|jgi:hypothetical protein|nr:hypothetical protein [Pseudomonadota bacterium]